MGCEPWREAISAQCDGEPLGVDEALLTAHLGGCDPCRDFRARADRMHRSMRLRPADPVPDRTAAILAAAAADRGRFPRLDPTTALRWVLVVIAAAETGLSASEVLSRWHTSGELGTWGIAASIGFLSVAARPARAGAMLPMLICASVLTAFVSSRDIRAGATRIAWEWPHGLLIAGVAVLAMLWWRERSEPPRRSVRFARDGASRRSGVRRAA
jgi:predicted anti-sigma-YlaC factor YlaD